MLTQEEIQRTITKSQVEDCLLNWVEAFLIDRKARGLARGTLRFYQQKLWLLYDFCESQIITEIG